MNWESSPKRASFSHHLGGQVSRSLPESGDFLLTTNYIHRWMYVYNTFYDSMEPALPLSECFVVLENV